MSRHRTLARDRRHRLAYRGRPHPRSTLLRIESLEPRCLLSGDFLISRLTPKGLPSAPFDLLEIEFSKPVQEGTFTAGDIAMSILGGSSIAPAEPTKLADDRYEVSFSGLTGSNTYVLSIGPDILDADGVPMNQDGDATPGEAGEDAYQAGLVSNALSLADGDPRLDGKDLVFFGNNTSAIAGAHEFRDVQVLAGARVNASEPGLTLAELQLDGGSTLAIAGGSTLTVTGSIEVDGNSTVLCQGKNVIGQVDEQWAGVGVTINAGSVTVDAGSKITATGQGYVGGVTYAPGQGPGAGRKHEADGGGGGYGGQGGGVGFGGATYGSWDSPTQLGSGGGGGSHGYYQWYGNGGRGGGAISLNVDGTLTLNGAISADGTDATGSLSGGGSGGSLRVRAGSLAGSGTFSAVGGNASTASNQGGYAGGGGRIAVSYAANSGFTGFAASTAAAGTAKTPAQLGTVAFLDTSLPGNELYVYENLVFAEDTSAAYGAITLSDQASLVLGGGSLVRVDGALAVTENSTIVCRGKNNAGQVDGEWLGGGVIIAAGSVTVDLSSTITADGQGYGGGHFYDPGKGPGAGRKSGAGGGGGGYGGRGGGTNYGGATYGSADFPSDLVSGGGGGSHGYYQQYGDGGAGGGAIGLQVAGTLTVDGTISANGADGTGWHSGGGSGGSIWVSADTLTGSGSILARGGNGPPTGRGGGGGRIAAYTRTDMALAPDRLSAVGGTGGAGDGAGQNGSVLTSTSPYLTWRRFPGSLFHDTETLRWAGLGLPPTYVADLKAFGSEHTIGTGLPLVGSVDWDTKTVLDGVYDVRATFRDASGTESGSITQHVLVNNSVQWHAGRIAANETWSADKVHAVERNLTIGAGATVTVEPGSVVKFVNGTGLTIEANGRLDAAGSADQPVIFTSLQDDTAGGDTNHDGEASRARPGDWKGIAGSGVLNVSESTQVRYATASHSGTLGSNQTWDGNWVHVIGDEVVVPAGVTLSIEPGSIVKFAAGKRLRVQAGGTTSTLAWPRAGTAAPCAGGRNPSGLRRRGPADLLHLPA